MSPTSNWYRKGEPEQMLEKKSSLRPGPFAEHLCHHPGTCRVDWTPVSSRKIKQRCTIHAVFVFCPSPEPGTNWEREIFSLSPLS